MIVDAGEGAGDAAVVCTGGISLVDIVRGGWDEPVPESRSVTSNRDLSSSIAGTKLERWMPFLYRSSGWRLHNVVFQILQTKKRDMGIL